MNRVSWALSLLTVLTLICTTTSGQPTSDFSLLRTAFSGGAVSISDSSISLRGTVAEAGIVGPISGRPYSLGAGFWSGYYRIIATDAPETLESSIQLVNSLSPIFPNPFTDRASIVYTVAHKSPVRLTLYNVTGRRITRLVDENQRTGRYRVHWNGRDGHGQNVVPGVYFCKIDIGSWSQTQKILRIR
jgi:hypothetical protein